MHFRMSIAGKLTTLTIVSALFMSAVGFSGYWGLERVSHNTNKLMKQDAKIDEISADLAVQALQMRRFEKDIFINVGDPTMVNEYESKWKAEHAKALGYLERIHEVMTLSEDQRRVEDLRSKLSGYMTGM